uniref:Uncharacterized protein n=1 Tax=Solanum lycopersicum TaxID=4081 RepID=A0A3Q7I164_SOLLC
MNCLMSIYYDMPFVHPHIILVVNINKICLFMQLCYISIFFFYIGKKYRLKIVSMLFGTFLSLHTYTNNTRLSEVLLSPLKIYVCIPSINQTLSITCLLYGIYWSIYALLKFDP